MFSKEPNKSKALLTGHICKILWLILVNFTYLSMIRVKLHLEVVVRDYGAGNCDYGGVVLIGMTRGAEVV